MSTTIPSGDQSEAHIVAAKERRRLQTRLAQRRYRLRKRQGAAYLEEQTSTIEGSMLMPEAVNTAATRSNSAVVDLQAYYSSIVNRNMDLFLGMEEMYSASSIAEEMAGKMVSSLPSDYYSSRAAHAQAQADASSSSYASTSYPSSSYPSSSYPSSSYPSSSYPSSSYPSSSYPSSSYPSSSYLSSSYPSSSTRPSMASPVVSCAPLPVNMSAMVVAAETEEYTSMAMLQNNKMSMIDLMSTVLSGDHATTVLELRRGERVPIPQYDFYRAVFANAFALSFSASDMGKCRVSSRIREVWNKSNHFANVSGNMQPVEEQLTVDHNIIIDLLPWPEVRRKALRSIQVGILDEETFKRDTFFGTNEDFGLETSFQIHGISPNDDFRFSATGASDVTTDPDSWQCSPNWMEKYWFLIDEQMLRRTNWWRKLQGQAPVVIRALSQPVMPRQDSAS
ncbi:hypothetical protein CBS101457_006544 [Exobasidium rhododendri]|nr:hypothetical protein CBS101457_006544 [Exobasidium rhododendri]